MQAFQPRSIGELEQDAVDRLARAGDPDVDLAGVLVAAVVGLGLVDPDLADPGDVDRGAGAGQDALDRGDDLVVDRSAPDPGARHVGRAGAERGAGPGALAGGVLEGEVVAEGEPELEHPEQEHHEDRDRDRELDQALAAAPARDGQAPDGRPHRTGSIRIAFDSTRVKLLMPSPMNEPIGVMNV